MTKYILLLLLGLLFSCYKNEFQFKKQKIELGVKNHFRGLSIANDNSIWVGGTNGIFITSSDKGNLWKVDSVKKYSTLDFRSSLAKSKNEVILLSAGTPAIMIHTNDKGNSWKELFIDSTKTVFFNSIKKDIAIGDPQGKTIDILKNKNGKWKRLSSSFIPNSSKGEAGFAASNTCIDYDKKTKTYWIGLGGERGIKVYKSTDDGNSFEAFETPMQPGKARGIYSIDFRNNKIGVAVGGSYLNVNGTKSAIYTTDGGENWKLPIAPPSGFKSCVTYFKGSIFVAVGTNGMDISYDDGRNWEKIDDVNLNAIQFLKGTNIAIAVGNYGAVYRYTFH